MSTSSSGCESRMFSAGMRLWPPASTLAPGRSSELERLGERTRLRVGKRRRLHLPNLLVEAVMITSEEDTMTVLGSICAALLFAVTQLACAQGYPSQPIRLIAPFPPGGSVDITARLIGEPLGAQLGTRIVIDNRSGASGNIGMEPPRARRPTATRSCSTRFRWSQPGAVRQAHVGSLPGFRADRHGRDLAARARGPKQSRRRAWPS